MLCLPFLNNYYYVIRLVHSPVDMPNCVTMSGQRWALDANNLIKKITRIATVYLWKDRGLSTRSMSANKRTPFGLNRQWLDKPVHRQVLIMFIVLQSDPRRLSLSTYRSARIWYAINNRTGFRGINRTLFFEKNKLIYATILCNIIIIVLRYEWEYLPVKPARICRSIR